MEPKPAAISAVGPSRPAEPPEPIVIAEASIFTGATRARSVPPVKCSAFTTVSVPWPSVSGASPYTSAPEINPPSAHTTGISHSPCGPMIWCATPPSVGTPGGV